MVYCHFYSVGVGRNKVVNCRSVLEIVEKLHAPGKTSVLAKRKPDAVFIMMNPGSSRKHELALKLTKHKTIPVVRAWGVSPKLDPLIERCTSRITKNKTIRGLLKEGTTNK